MPKIEIPQWKEMPGEPSPITGENNGPYAERVLGDIVGLSQFGVRMERLAPGSSSSQRHWHETEDEFLYVVSGELILVEDEETVITAGECAAWKANDPIAHCLENRSKSDAVVLVVGTRSSKDVVHYTDHDVLLHRDGDAYHFTKADGTPITPED